MYVSRARKSTLSGAHTPKCVLGTLIDIQLKTHSSKRLEEITI